MSGQTFVVHQYKEEEPCSLYALCCGVEWVFAFLICWLRPGWKCPCFAVAEWIIVVFLSSALNCRWHRTQWHCWLACLDEFWYELSQFRFEILQAWFAIWFTQTSMRVGAVGRWTKLQAWRLLPRSDWWLMYLQWDDLNYFICLHCDAPSLFRIHVVIKFDDWLWLLACQPDTVSKCW